MVIQITFNCLKALGVTGFADLQGDGWFWKSALMVSHPFRKRMRKEWGTEGLLSGREVFRENSSRLRKKA